MSYKIKWRKTGKGKGNTYTAKPSERHNVISDLERGTKYQIRIWAANVNGTGPGSDWIEVETFQNDVDENKVPDKPTNLKGRLYLIVAFVYL